MVSDPQLKSVVLMKISTIFQVGQYWINSLISDIAHCEVSYLKTKKNSK